MQYFRLALATLLATASMTGFAHALEIDQAGTGQGAAAANLADPDDKIPYPHLDDNGQPSQSGSPSFQIQGGNGASVSGYGTATQPSGAFQRALQNQQQ